MKEGVYLNRTLSAATMEMLGDNCWIVLSALSPFWSVRLLPLENEYTMLGLKNCTALPRASVEVGRNGLRMLVPPCRLPGEILASLNLPDDAATGTADTFVAIEPTGL